MGIILLTLIFYLETDMEINIPKAINEARELHKELGGANLQIGLLLNVPRSVNDVNSVKKEIQDITGKKVDGMCFFWEEKNLLKNIKKSKTISEKLEKYAEIEELDGTRVFQMRKPIKTPLGELPGILGCNEKIDAKQYYEDKLETLRKKIHLMKDNVKQSQTHQGVALILFNTVNDCEYTITHWNSLVRKIKNHPLSAQKWRFKYIPVHEEIYWENLNEPKLKRKLMEITFTAIILLFALFWSIPVTFLSNLSNLTLIPIIGDVILNFINSSPFFANLIETTLPVLLTLILFSFFPDLCMFLAKKEKQISLNEVYCSAMVKYWFFVIFNGFIFYVLFTSGIDIFHSFQKNDNQQYSIVTAFEEIDWSIYGAFYCSYFITVGVLDSALTAVQLTTLIPKYLKKYIYSKSASKAPSEVEAIFDLSPYQYFMAYTKETIYFAVILTFSPVVPILTLFALLAYVLMYVTDKNTILLVHSFDHSTNTKIITFFDVLVNISLMLAMLFWLFFFLAHEATTILYFAVPVYIILWGVYILLVVYAGFSEKRKIAAFAAHNDFPGASSIEEFKYYTWDYLTSDEYMKSHVISKDRVQSYTDDKSVPLRVFSD